MLLGALGSTPAHADLAARSRNSVVFVESIREGEQWEAFRVVDARHPAVFLVGGPGRVFLKLRTLARAEPVDAVAAVLRDEEIVLTARVPATVDDSAKMADEGGRPSLAKLYLLQVDERARVTIRHSGGPALLVLARYAPPLEASAAEGDDLPLVAPRAEPKATVPRIGALRRGGNSLAADPLDPSAASPVPVEEAAEAGLFDAPLPDGDADPNRPEEPEPAEPPPPSRRGPALGDDPEPHPALAEDMALDTRPLDVEAFLLLEVRGGAHFDRITPAPGPTLGLDFRGALLGPDRPRLLTVGVSLDLGYARGEDEVTSRGAPVGVARVSHTFGGLTADLRLRLLEFPDVAEVYVSAGAGVLLGRAQVETRGDTRSAGTRGFVGTGRVGATLGTTGSRPFLEIRAWGGSFQSEVVRAGPGSVVGDPTAYFAVAAMVGWRIEIGFEVER